MKLFNNSLVYTLSLNVHLVDDISLYLKLLQVQYVGEH